MLTEEQFFITEQVKNEIENDFATYTSNLYLKPGQVSYFDFAYYEIENYDKLNLILNSIDKKQEFLVNSYYFLLDQVKFYRSNDEQFNSATENAFKDLRDIYSNYNNIEPTIN